MTLAALIGGPIYFTWGALALFIATTAVTVCLGHSLGMHRRLIHRSYDCPLWLERLFVYLGTLVGMAGPYGMIRQHDIRDWAQRKPACHPYLAHRSSMLRDGFWQLHCELTLAHPPALVMERRVRRGSLLPVHRAHLDGAAAAVGGAVLRDRRHAVAGVGHRGAGGGLRHRALAGRLLRAQPGAALLAHRGRRRAGLQRAATAGSSPWARPGTTTTTPSRARRASASAPARPIPAGGCWWRWSSVGLVWNVKTPEMLPHRPNLVALLEACATSRPSGRARPRS